MAFHFHIESCTNVWIRKTLWCSNAVKVCSGLDQSVIHISTWLYLPSTNAGGVYLPSFINWFLAGMSAFVHKHTESGWRGLHFQSSVNVPKSLQNVATWYTPFIKSAVAKGTQLWLLKLRRALMLYHVTVFIHCHNHKNSDTTDNNIVDINALALIIPQGPQRWPHKWH